MGSPQPATRILEHPPKPRLGLADRNREKMKKKATQATMTMYTRKLNARNRMSVQKEKEQGRIRKRRNRKFHILTALRPDVYRKGKLRRADTPSRSSDEILIATITLHRPRQHRDRPYVRARPLYHKANALPSSEAQPRHVPRPSSAQQNLPHRSPRKSRQAYLLDFSRQNLLYKNAKSPA